MSAERWALLTIRLGVAGIVVGLGVIVALFWGSGEQATSGTQLPYVLVAGGAGVGLVLVGIAFVNAQRARLDRQRVEDAAAAMLLGAAKLSAARSAALAAKADAR